MEDLDELVFDLELDGEEVRRELRRRTWEAGGWATIAIVYEDKKRDGDEWVRKVALLRMKKVRGLWKKHALVTMRDEEAKQLAILIGEPRVE